MQKYNNVLNPARRFVEEIRPFAEKSRQGHDWCHTISNALIVVSSLLYGGMDYSKSICMAVETGFDTDCNGATVGSIIGMAKGIKAIPQEWYYHMNDTLQTSIFDKAFVKISDCINKTLEHIKA